MKSIVLVMLVVLFFPSCNNEKKEKNIAAWIQVDWRRGDNKEYSDRDDLSFLASYESTFYEIEITQVDGKCESYKVYGELFSSYIPCAIYDVSVSLTWYDFRHRKYVTDANFHYNGSFEALSKRIKFDLYEEQNYQKDDVSYEVSFLDISRFVGTAHRNDKSGDIIEFLPDNECMFTDNSGTKNGVYYTTRTNVCWVIDNQTTCTEYLTPQLGFLEWTKL